MVSKPSPSSFQLLFPPQIGPVQLPITQSNVVGKVTFPVTVTAVELVGILARHSGQVSPSTSTRNSVHSRHLYIINDGPWVTRHLGEELQVIEHDEGDVLIAMLHLKLEPPVTRHL